MSESMRPDVNDVWSHHLSFVHIVRQRMWRLIVGGTIVMLAGAAIYPILPRTYSSTTLVLLQPTDQFGQPIIGRSTSNALDENEIQAYDDILSSRYMLQTVIDKLQLLNDPEFNPHLNQSRFQNVKNWVHAVLMLPPLYAEEAVMQSVRAHLFIIRSRKSYAFQIGFKSGNPAKAAAMANTLAASFVADRLANKTRFQIELTKNLETRQVTLEKNYADSERKLHDFLVQSGLIHKGEQEAARQQLDSFSKQFAKASDDADHLEYRAKQALEMQRSGSLDTSADVLASPVVKDLKERLMTLSSGTGASGQITGSASPTALRDLRDQINAEAIRIARSLQAESLIARFHANALQNQIKLIDSKLMHWQEAERELQNYQMAVEADRHALQENMNQLRAQGAVIAALRSDADVISPAVVSSRPSFPNLLIYGVATIFVALLVVAGLILPSLLVPTMSRSHARIR